VLVHDYLGIDLDRMWLVVQEDVSAFKETLPDLLEAAGQAR